MALRQGSGVVAAAAVPLIAISFAAAACNPSGLDPSAPSPETRPATTPTVPTFIGPLAGPAVQFLADAPKRGGGVCHSTCTSVTTEAR